jgi:hypothetical protein
MNFKFQTFNFQCVYIAHADSNIGDKVTHETFACFLSYYAW